MKNQKSLRRAQMAYLEYLVTKVYPYTVIMGRYLMNIHVTSFPLNND